MLRSHRLLCCLLVAAATLVAGGCRAPAPVRPSEPIYAGDDYLGASQERTFREFLVGPGNLRETGEPPSFQDVADRSTRKLVRGLANIATGWMEVPKQTYNTWYEERGIASPFIGLGKGIGMAISRELVGVFETGTFFMPVPGDWKPILRPEYVFQPEHPRSALQVEQRRARPWWRGGAREEERAELEGADEPPEDRGPAPTAPAPTNLPPPPAGAR